MRSLTKGKRGLIPILIAHGCDYPDVSLIYGSSDVDIIANEQELLNTLTELNVEAYVPVFPEPYRFPSLRASDNQTQHQAKVYPLPTGAAMDWQQPTIIPNQRFCRAQQHSRAKLESASVSEISKGITATDSTTATEIKGLCSDQADIRSEKRPTTLRKGFFMQEATIVFKYSSSTQTITI